MARLAFCDYHNMIAILEKYEHNVDFHPIVDFVEASYIRYALTINPTVYVSYIRQFWSTARIKTTDEGTKILATVDGKPRTISESSIRRNLKLKDEAGISSLPDAELFENLTLMGYNISPNQKFSFQKGQFSHQWKYLIHTIMQCLSPKSTGFNEFSSNIATALVCLATNRVYNFSKMIFDGMVQNVNNKVSKFLMYPRQYTRRARIAQSSALLTVANEPASPLGDDSQGEACPTISGFKAEQDMANIIKTSTFPIDSTPRVTSIAADEGSMQHKLQELTDLCTRLQRQQDEMVLKITAQDLEISSLKARVQLLEDRDRGCDDPSGEDATIKGRSLETREEAGIKRSTDKGSNDTEEMVNVLTSLDASSILTSRVQVSVPPTVEVATSHLYHRYCGYTLLKKERDAEIARIHAEEELQILIDSLDRTNETVAKYMHEYEQFAEDLSVGERIELINDLVKYQYNYAKVLKYQSQQRKPLLRKQQREFYISIEDFVPMGSKEEGERFKRKGLRLEQDSTKKAKISEEVLEKDLKTMMHLVPVEEGRFELAMGVSERIRQATSDKEKELWVELKRLYEPDVEDQLWTQTQALMHDPVEWRLYDTCGVHHVLSRDQENFIDEFPLPEDFPTASEDLFPLLSERDATAEKVCTANEDKGEEAFIERSTDKGSNDTEEMVNVLTSLDAASILTSGVQVSVPPTAEVATVSIPHVGEIPTVSVPTSSGVVPTASPIFTTATVATPYSRRKCKEKMVESKTPKKKKLQEQIDVQMARQLEEEMARDAQRMNEQIAMDAEITRIHAEEELQILIDSLDRTNETVAKYLHEYEQFAEDLSVGERIELINDLVKYQDNYAKVLKYQSQQRKPLSKKQQREFYMSVLKSHAGWKTKHFKGMSLEEIREKFVPDSAKKAKISEEVSEEDLKTMMHLVPVEEGRFESAMGVSKRIRQATSYKEKELRVELKRLYEPDVEDQLWTQTQALMHDPVEWRLYDTCGIPTASDEFPLPEDFPTVSEDLFLLMSERDATAEEVCTANEDKGRRSLCQEQQVFGDRGGIIKYLNKWSSSEFPPAAEVATVSIPSVGEIPTISVPTGSGVVPTASLIFTTATVATPYSRRKGKEKMVESETPKKKKLQEQIDVQMARQLEEEMARDAQRLNEQIARDAEIARIHAEEEFQILIDSLDRTNETVAKYLHEEDLNQLWALVKETLNIRQATSDKEKELWVELKRLYEPDVEDQLFPLLSERDAPAEDVCIANEDKGTIEYMHFTVYPLITLLMVNANTLNRFIRLIVVDGWTRQNADIKDGVSVK
nr:synaptobrevin, longin-like domain protein [Tanacetum cinerariifolium]